MDDKDFYFILVELPLTILFFLFVLCLCHCLCHCIEKKKSLGYGGSPGHMSPLEVEELYQRNHK